MALVTYPLNNVDYVAEDAELFHCTRSSGIHVGTDFAYSITGADNSMTIGTGIAWIRNGDFAGKVAALKAVSTIDLGVADSTYPRIDAVVLQFSANRNDTDIVIKQGTAASSPVAPAVIRTEAVYELHLYHVHRKAGATAITAADITDLRLSSEYCGLMADSVTRVDTDAIYKQLEALIEQLRQEIEGVKDGSAYLMRSGGTMEGNVDMGSNRLVNLADPVDDNDAVNLAYMAARIGRNVSVTEQGAMAVGATFEVSESIIGKNPVFATLAYYPAMGRATGGTGNTQVKFYNITSLDGGLYLNYAVFNLTDDGLTLTLESTKRVKVTAGAVTVEEGITFNFGEVKLVFA